MTPRCRRGHIRTPANTHQRSDGKIVCRECRRARVRRWLQTPANTDKMKGWIRGHRRRGHASRLALVRRAKNKPCADCGRRFPHYVMDFDHRHDKTYLIGRMAHTTIAISKILAEIAKCDVVCANCHRERTYGPT